MTPLDPIAVPLSGTTLIEASAGTGKTYTITTLVLRMLVERGLHVRQILVVTFTQAAAAELRDRIRRRVGETLAALESGGGFERDPEFAGWLAARREAGCGDADRAQLERALRDFDEASISTIHAYCQRVLSEHAFESRSAFESELVEQQTPLLEEVTYDFWANNAYRAAPELLRSMRAKAAPRKLLSLAWKVMRDPTMPVLPPAPESPLPSLQRWGAALTRAAELWLEQRSEIVRELLRPERLHKGSHAPDRIAGEWASALDQLAQAQPGQLPPCVAKLTEAALAKATRKQQQPPRHAFFAALTELQAAHDEMSAALDVRVLALRRELVDYVREQVSRRRRKQGVQGFDDLLVQLRAALGGSAGAALASKLIARHPVALIDEFQDTDPVQYEIFSRLYARGSLFLIGDPKQAIYGFRGADIFAYLQAARQPGLSAHTLAVNHRSDPRLIQALNTLFARPERPFLFPEIKFQPVRPSPTAHEHMAQDDAALQLLFVPRSLADAEAGKRGINKGWGDRNLPKLIAQEIVRLLHAAPQVGEAPLHPSHMAVLCRTNQQAKQTARELARLGVPTVLDGDSSVFDGDMAEELSRVLWAIARPAEARKLGAALASSVLGVDGEALFAMRQNEADLELWLDRLARWNVAWHERGFMHMWHQMLEEADVRARLLQRADGERRLTDLLHLSELLHEAALQQHLGPLSLLHWFTQMRADTQVRSASMAAESAQLRLEHDEHALKLTTIHRSKGLEYPIVFCPFSWADGTGADDEVVFHDRDDGDRLKLDLGSGELDAHKALAQREALAENLRLLYVALTRARHRCYVVWGRFSRCGRSPLGYLLHARETSDEFDLDAVESRIAPLSDGELSAELEELATLAEGTIALRELQGGDPAPYRAMEQARGSLSARSTTRVLRHGPRMTSFSHLTSEQAGEASATAEERFEHDPDADAELVAAGRRPAALPSAPVALADFPSGPGPGSLIHAVYEHIDFQRPDPDELARQVEHWVSAFGLDPAQLAPTLRAAIAATLRTPLDRAEPALTLACIAPAQRRAELEFLLSTNAGLSGLGPALAAVFERHAAPSCAPGYTQRLRALGNRAGAGFLRGFIDLVFRHEGRYFIVDYKSNHLGNSANDYRGERLVESMQEHHYFLQYHLYALALHRHLSLREANYDFERCFGGVYYLFVRGMSPEHEPGTGVFFDRPSLPLLEDLARTLGAAGVAA